MGLVYPYLFILNFTLLFYWLIQWKRFFIIPFSVLLVGAYFIGDLFQVNIPFKKVLNQKSFSNKRLIKVMTYNVRVFDLYNWTKNKETRNEIFNLLQEENPDIICFQEYYRDASLKFKTHDTLVTFLKASNAHIQITKTLHKTDEWGIATYTRYPIVNKGVIYFHNTANNICIYTDLKVNTTDTIRVYNLHLQSVHFSNKDYKFISDLLNRQKTDEIKGSKRILSLLKNAYIKRAQQADAVAAHIKQCKYPVLVCGDFNDTPLSYTYHTIKSNLSDCYKKAGSGFGKTYAGFFAPYRIDYILCSSQFNVLNFRVLPDELSDHYPVVSILEKK